MKVTFEKNFYEYLIDPKKSGPIVPDEKSAADKIGAEIRNEYIKPLISETILTYESLKKAERRKNIVTSTALVSAV